MFNKTLFYFFSTSILTVSNTIVLSPAFAQITTDGSTNTTLTPTNNGVRIDDGSRAGGNLFHSFGEFSVPTGSEAFFNNALDIVNIFSRVTGGRISNIDGLIRANGGANLFLINPAGILFGNNASLQIGGSFYGSTADSILFSDGIEFSATNTQQRPLLTINAPIGLNLRDNPQPIINRSVVQNTTNNDVVGLEVQSGNTLSLVGGNIRFETGQATASGGNIELGGLSDAGIVTLNDDGSLSFPEDVARADITLNNGADIDVRGTGGGNITINGRNVSLSAGDFGRSQIRAGITADSTSAEAQAGDITINATDNVTVDNSLIINDVEASEIGNPPFIPPENPPIGNAPEPPFIPPENPPIGNAPEPPFILPENPPIGNAPEPPIGNAGVVEINTNNLNLTNGGQISASARSFGVGNAGTITINAADSINVDGINSAYDPFSSEITIESPFSSGNPGVINIDTNNLNLTNGGQISANNGGVGDAGTITINATYSINVDGVSSAPSPTFGIILYFPSQITSGTGPVEGNAGVIEIKTNNLNLTNGGLISASSFGPGDAGTITINATDSINVDGGNITSFPSKITITSTSSLFQIIGTIDVGNAGVIEIKTNNFNLTNGGIISTTNVNTIGNAGTVTINAAETINVDNSEITSSVNNNAIGNAGNVNLTAPSISITNESNLSTATDGEGNA
ncbi:MAG: filamentous hemagglutinin N-terminal domain-containing protein, partial [Xenococcaceae cyanobacterium MO_207.B15]|nr:filamentous hemagglutinin N-terminal domain-containing protein [Xenococcaceae cyanobacterium MO_207.B15]